jgi:subtilisin family serine protease
MCNHNSNLQLFARCVFLVTTLPLLLLRGGEYRASVHQGGSQFPESAKSIETYPPCGSRVRASEVLVKFGRPVRAQIVKSMIKELAKDRAHFVKEVGTGSTVFLVHINGLKVTDLMNMFFDVNRQRANIAGEEIPVVQHVEPNLIFQDDSPVSPPQANKPDDLNEKDQWGLLDSTSSRGGVSAVSAWNTTQGSRNIVVGVVDSGIRYDHPDLRRNIWCAPRDFTVRVGGRDISCAKGSHGFNATTNTCDPAQNGTHGTQVSGILGAEGNNTTGIVGVNWRTSIMGLSWSQGEKSSDEIINAISFAVEVKRQGDLADIRVLNNSYGAYTNPGQQCRPQLLAEQIEKAKDAGILFVASAGDIYKNTDNDPHYPSGLDIPNIISVAGTTIYDKLYSASSFGQTSVHIGAPGGMILSTTLNGYDGFGGTSAAAPFVTGAAALILSKPSCANLTATQLKQAMLQTADHVKALKDYIPDGRRLNIKAAITKCERYLNLRIRKRTRQRKS